MQRPCSVLITLFVLASSLAGCIAELVELDDEQVELEVDAVQQELIVGSTDDRARVTQGMSTAYPWRSVAAIRLTANTTVASCSAFKVGPRHLLSAAHCFYEKRVDGSFATKVPLTSFRLIIPQYGSGNAAANMPVVTHKVPIQTLYVPSNYISTKGASTVDDWALIQVADNESTPGWFRVKAWTEWIRTPTGCPRQAPFHGKLAVDRTPRSTK